MKDRKAVRTLIVFSKKHSGKVFRYSTGQSIDVAHWDDRNQRCRTRGIDKPSAQRNRLINNILSDIEYAYDDAMVFARRSAKRITNAYLKKHIDRALEKGVIHQKPASTLADAVKVFVEHSNSGRRTTRNGRKLSRRRIQVYETFGRLVDEHFPNVAIEDIDRSFYDQFVNTLNSQGKALSTVGKDYKVLASVLRYARVLKLGNAPLLDDDGQRSLSEQVDHVYLNRAEIEQLTALPLSGSKARVRDIFVIMCYMGVRISDYKQLDNDSFEDDSRDMVRIISVKTGTEVYIPVHPKVLQIVDAHGGFPDPFSEQKMNRDIKEICRDAGLIKPFRFQRTVRGQRKIITMPKCDLVSLHTARRSFATNAYLAGVDTLSIMHITGHKREKTLLGYICATKKEKADRISRHAFFKN